MFTGLIVSTAKIITVQKNGMDARLTLQALKPLPDMVCGESIAVNGVCLTVENFTDSTFNVFASSETLACTTLKDFSHGHVVNIERALRLSDRLGGHLVTGHVDTLATITHINPKGQSLQISIKLPRAFMSQVLPKGSITLDGISLTINSVEEDCVSVNCIPETAKITTIARWRVGTLVNIETDIIGKYVLSHLSGMGFKHTTNTSDTNTQLSKEFLQQHGFLS